MAAGGRRRVASLPLVPPAFAHTHATHCARVHAVCPEALRNGCRHCRPLRWNRALNMGGGLCATCAPPVRRAAAGAVAASNTHHTARNAFSSIRRVYCGCILHSRHDHNRRIFIVTLIVQCILSIFIAAGYIPSVLVGGGEKPTLLKVRASTISALVENVGFMGRLYWLVRSRRLHPLAVCEPRRVFATLVVDRTVVAWLPFRKQFLFCLH